MANFQFFVHRTAGIIADISSVPANLPEGGFYNLARAEQFAATIADGRNMVAIYDAGGKLHISMPFSNKGQS